VVVAYPETAHLELEEINPEDEPIDLHDLDTRELDTRELDTRELDPSELDRPDHRSP
jgi:hypothetical protein